MREYRISTINIDHVKNEASASGVKVYKSVTIGPNKYDWEQVTPKDISIGDYITLV